MNVIRSPARTRVKRSPDPDRGAKILPDAVALSILF